MIKQWGKSSNENITLSVRFTLAPSVFSSTARDSDVAAHDDQHYRIANVDSIRKLGSIPMWWKTIGY